MLRGTSTRGYAVRLRGLHSGAGFTFLDILCSVLLVAGIAVLSLPTIQNLTPLSGYLERNPGSLPASETAATDESHQEHAATAKGAAEAVIEASAAEKRDMEAGNGQATPLHGGRRQ